MFTGLVEEIGRVQAVIKGPKSARIVIKACKTLDGVCVGDSICTDGVCLTVTEFSSDSFTVDVMAETIRRSSLKELSPGDEVNLERALKVGDRLGGHIVSGHIDGTGIIESYKKDDNAVWVTISAPHDILKYIVQKGSIAIDGISLTVACADDSRFGVSIIPHTKDATTLLRKKAGDTVNLECDIIGKYVEKLFSMRVQEPAEKGIDMNFLNKYGFA